MPEPAVRVGQSKPDPPPFVPYGPPGLNTPAPSWMPPEYAGADPGYAAWLANARMRGTNAQSDAKMRKAQAEEAYRQALQDIEFQATQGRRQLQGGMLQRGIFRSGETDRRKGEFDAAIEQGESRALTAQTNQFGQIDADERNYLANLALEGTNQVSQAMLRDQLAAYQAQQQSAATPAAASYAPQPQVQAKPAPYAGTSASTAQDPRYRVPAKPKPAPSGSTGKLKQTRKGGAQLQ